MRVDLVVGNIERTIGNIVRGLRGGLTIHENVRSEEVTVLDTGLANADITIAHNLGNVPRYYFYNIDRAGIVYDQNKAGWTTTSMVVRCSVANARITVVAF